MNDLTLREIASLLDKTTITLAIDLSAVHALGPGEEFQMPGDADVEVYIVSRSGGSSYVRALVIGGDRLTIRVDNIPDEP